MNDKDVDIAAVNALILWITKHPNWNQNKSHLRRLFFRNLGMQLVNRHVQQKMTSTVRKRRRLQDSARQSGFALSTATRESSADENGQKQTAKRKNRCVRCPRKVDRKVARCCSACNVTVCEEHREEEHSTTVTRRVQWFDFDLQLNVKLTVTLGLHVLPTSVSIHVCNSLK